MPLSANDVLSIAASVKDLGMAVKDLRGATAGDNLLPNPHFVQNGHEGSSRRTKSYLSWKRIKSCASVGFSGAGLAASAVTQVNAADIAKHGNSTKSTALHVRQLHKMSGKVRDGGSLKRHLGLVITLKQRKLLSRGGQLVTSSIPSPIASFVGTGAALIHEHSVSRLEQEIYLTAIGLHWQAFREVVLLGDSVHQKPQQPKPNDDPFANNPNVEYSPLYRSAKGIPAPPPLPTRQLFKKARPARKIQRGPALRIVHELTTRGIGESHSPQRINQIMREPAGYLILMWKLHQT